MDSPIVIYVSMAIWGITLWRRRHLAADGVGGRGRRRHGCGASHGGDIWNVAIAVVLAGGMLLDGYGAASFPWAMLALLLGALTIAWCAHRHSSSLAGAVVAW